MACCCEASCTTRTYEPDGTAHWQGPGNDKPGAARWDIAVDSSGNAYTAFGGVEKLSDAGTQTYKTANDGRFYGRGLRAIAVTPDGSVGYVGSSHSISDPFALPFTGPDVFKIDLSDGSVIAEATVGSFGITINDIVLDGSGGVYVATSEGVAHFNSSFARLDDVGCAVAAEALDVDDSGNLWVAGGPCTTTLSSGCSVTWTVRKYSSSGTLLDGINLTSPTAIDWRDGYLHVGFEAAESGGCNVVKFNATTWACVWSFAVGEGPYADKVRDIAVSGDHIYAVSNQFLFALNPATGAKDWCRKNEGTKLDGITKRAAQLYAVAVGQDGEGNDLVWVTGQATPCNDAEEDSCDSGSCTNAACTCECGTKGRTGGTLVRGCDCDEAPCLFDFPITSADCATLDGGFIRWTRDADDVTKWTGFIHNSAGSYIGRFFIAEMDCESSTNGGWSLTSPSVGISGIAITENWCAEGAPAGAGAFPGFRGVFTIEFDSGTCEDVCISFSDAECPAATVDSCSCTGIPSTLTASITSGTCAAANGQTVSLAYNGANWEGTVTISGKVWGFALFCGSAIPGKKWSLGAPIVLSYDCTVTPTPENTGVCPLSPLVFTGVFMVGTSCCGGSSTALTVSI